MYLYLIERGPKHQCHKAPFHPVVICTARHTAKWEARASSDATTVWSRGAKIGKDTGHTWFMNRWKGLDITFIGAAIYFNLPDGTNTRVHCERAQTLIAGAVWWSDQPLPEWLRQAGVIEAPDDFTREAIVDDRGLCLLSESQAAKIRERRERCK